MHTMYVLERILVVLGILATLYVSFVLSQSAAVRWAGSVGRWLLSSMVFVGSTQAWRIAEEQPVFRHLFATCGVLGLIVAAGTMFVMWRRSAGARAIGARV